MRVPSALAAGVLVAVLALAGCSKEPGAAAIVDGHAVSTADLDTVFSELHPIFPDATVDALLMLMVISPTYLKEVEAQGQAVSTKEATAYLTSSAKAAGVTTKVFSDASVRVIRLALEETKLKDLPKGPEIVALIDAKLNALDVEINPRFGTFDTTTRTIVANAPEWIVTPASK